jgi:hypothetical protein
VGAAILISIVAWIILGSMGAQLIQQEIDARLLAVTQRVTALERERYATEMLRDDIGELKYRVSIVGVRILGPSKWHQKVGGMKGGARASSR